MKIISENIKPLVKDDENDSDDGSDDGSDDESDDESGDGSDDESDDGSVDESDDDSSENSDVVSDKESDNDLDENDDQPINKNYESDSSTAECIQIISKTGKAYYLEEDSMIIYEPQGEDNGNELGMLTKVNDKKAPFFKGGLHYIIGKMIKVGKKEYIMCVITKRAYFNDKYLGKAVSTSKGKYKIVK